jgi:AcrR family transcriptional regulator
MAAISNDRVARRQQRTILYFVDAARDIVKTEGVKSATIRSVADLAGYTSATLYNYFDNLNHIIALATMNCIDDYAREADAAVAGMASYADIYATAADCFFRRSFESPEVFEVLFVAIGGGTLEKYMRQYYSLFPNIPRHGAKLIFRLALQTANSAGHDLSYLPSLVQKGVIAKQTADDFNDVVSMAYKCVLSDVCLGLIGKKAAYDKLGRILRQQIGFYAPPSKA